MNKTILLQLFLLVTTTACVGPRGGKNQAGAMASFPASQQEKIKEHRIEKGFNKEMVLLSLGTPDSSVSVDSHDATTLDEIWVYKYNSLRFIAGFPEDFRNKIPAPNSELTKIMTNYSLPTLYPQGVVAVGFRDTKVVDVVVKTNY